MTKFVRAALLGSVMMAATPAMAQDHSAQDARIDALIAEVEALRAEVAQMKAAQAQTAAAVEAQETPALDASWKGEPELKGDGFTFKPRGRLMYDVGAVSSPDGYSDEGLGFGSELRRGRMGVQGDIPGGFGYKFEIDFTDGEVAITDAYLSAEAGNAEIMIGQMNNFQSLEELTSSLNTSFIERAAFTDAFGFERRVGIGGKVTAGDFIAQGGLFTSSIDDLTDDENEARGADARLVYAPKLGDAQIHLGASVHFRDLGDGVQSVRYRQRPAIHITDTRFINTGSIGATSETSYGLEAAAILGRFHIAGEAHRLTANMPGEPDPTFAGGYVEAGVFLTNDKRGYKGGAFDRVKPSSPMGEGGWGSLQFNARYDYLDLSDAGIIGGTQNGYQASILWKPTDYVLFGLNYGHMVYDDAAITTADGDDSYSVDMIGLRSQIDF